MYNKYKVKVLDYEICLSTRKAQAEDCQMSLPDKVYDFYKRWNISYGDEPAFRLFKNRVLYVIDNTLGEIFLTYDDVVYRFAYLVGFPMKPKSTIGGRDILNRLEEMTEKSFFKCPVYTIFVNAKNSIEIISYLQFLFIAMEESEEISQNRIERFANELKSTIDITPSFDIRVIHQNKNVILYPGGAKLLDEELVNENLLWLEQYPAIRKHFQEALLIYAEKDVGKYRNLLDNLRLSIEELLRVILGNNKSLENQKSTLLKWLNEHSVSQQIIDMFNELLFQKYRLYQNELVKHGEGWSQIDIEFMIYLTGTFMRLLIKVSEDTCA